MVLLGAALVRKLIAAALTLAVLAGCSGNVGPNDPQMSPADESKLRENTMTAEEREAKAARPR